MLKLSGWPRLTWGRKSFGSLHADPLKSHRRPAIRAPLVPRSAAWVGAASAALLRPPLVAPSRAAFLHLGRPRTEIFSGTGGQSPRHPPGRTVGGGAMGGVTPRQACPRPDGLGRNLRSKTRWFTGFCNSHQVSHFATFFIDARAEISVAESRTYARVMSGPVAQRARPVGVAHCVRPDRLHFLGALGAGSFALLC